MLPIANRPLIEYWIELCVDLRVERIKFLLSDGGRDLEEYVGDGESWGISVGYAFNDWDGSRAFLGRNPEHWHAGLLYLCGPVFPARLKHYDQSSLSIDDYAYGHYEAGGSLFMGRGQSVVDELISGAIAERPAGFRHMGLSPCAIDSIKSYYDLNMRMISSDIAQYLSPGYSVSPDGSHIGANTVISPSAALEPPLIAGNNSKFFGMCTIGPNIVIGDNVIVDRQAEVSDCIVFSHSYIGRNIELKGKILAGGNIVDPELELCVPIVDNWLVSDTSGGQKRSFSRAAGFLASALVLAIQLPLIAVLQVAGLIEHAKEERFRAIDGRELSARGWRAGKGRSLVVRLCSLFALDKTSKLFCVLQGNLCLCGEPLRPAKDDNSDSSLSEYVPGVFNYGDLRGREEDFADSACLDSLYYHGHRSLREDFRILKGSFGYRIRNIFR